MSKTPEQMAEEYGASPQEKDASLAGYQAGQEATLDAQSRMDSAFDRMLQRAKGNSPEKSNSWISVKERLPEYDQLALLWQSELQAQFVGRRRDSGIVSPLYYWECTSDFFEAWKEIYHPKLMNEEVVTHWMPLPEPPKEEK